MPKVYVVQVPATRDLLSGEWVPKYDLSGAKSFGELSELLPRMNIGRNWQGATAKLKQALQDFTIHDYLVAVGDPCAIATAAVIAAEVTGGYVQLLKWDRYQQVYYPAIVDTRFSSFDEGDVLHDG